MNKFTDAEIKILERGAQHYIHRIYEQLKEIKTKDIEDCDVSLLFSVAVAAQEAELSQTHGLIDTEDYIAKSQLANKLQNLVMNKYNMRGLR